MYRLPELGYCQLPMPGAGVHASALPYASLPEHLLTFVFSGIIRGIEERARFGCARAHAVTTCAHACT